jgi:hypothetical protein
MKMVRLKVKIGKIGNSLKATIPREICDIMDIKAGQEMYIDVEDSKIILEKAV